MSQSLLEEMISDRHHHNTSLEEPSMSEIDAAWLTETLKDAEEALAYAIQLIEENPRKAAGVLEHEIPAVYAKLNYAVNTASVGAAGLETMTDDELVAWPAGLPFAAPAKEEAQGIDNV